jgi:halogenation protein CepH
MAGFDAVVIGGGPGGSTAATLIAKDGHRVLLLEKERFPRYQIGESLLPSTVHGIGALLGVTGELAAAGFPVKRGGTFRWGANPEPWTFTFALSRRLAESSSTAYQVERQRFDQILLDNARRCGVAVREEHEVVSLLRDGGRVTGVRFRDATGREGEARAPYVVVAAGNTGRLNQGIGVRELSPFFRNVALFGYFEGGRRLPAPDTGNILCAAFDTGWFWYIPLSGTLTSVGAVVARDRAGDIRRDPEAAMRRYIEACPIIAGNLADAHRVRAGMYAPLRVRTDYSYANSVFWNPGVVLVGDAACFVDPVFSTGVHLATYGGLLAARSINTRLRGGLSDDAAFGEFERRYRREYDLFYEFLQSMYDQNRDESSYFWQARRLLGAPTSDAEAFAELVAGVSGDGGETLAVHRPASPAAHDLSTALRQASRPDALDEGDIVLSGPDTRLLGAALHEATELQLRAGLAEHPDLLPAPAPLVPGGLTTTADGLRWLAPS